MKMFMFHGFEPPGRRKRISGHWCPLPLVSEVLGSHFVKKAAFSILELKSLFNRFAHSAGPDCMAVCLQAMGNCELVFGNALGSSTVLGRYLGKAGARIFSLSIIRKCVVMLCVCVCVCVCVCECV